MTYLEERRTGMLRKLGFEVKESIGGMNTTVYGEIETGKGKLAVMWGGRRSNDTAVVMKPNGTTKWLYEKTDAQILSTIRQTIKANT